MRTILAACMLLALRRPGLGLRCRHHRARQLGLRPHHHAEAGARVRRGQRRPGAGGAVPLAPGRRCHRAQDRPGRPGEQGLLLGPSTTPHGHGPPTSPPGTTAAWSTTPTCSASRRPRTPRAPTTSTKRSRPSPLPRRSGPSRTASAQRFGSLEPGPVRCFYLHRTRLRTPPAPHVASCLYRPSAPARAVAGRVPGPP